MRQFHPLTVTRLHAETPDSMRIALDVPTEIRQDFQFLPGQHLPVQVTLDGKNIRRTYSLCSAPGQYPLEIGVRVQPGGLFGRYAQDVLAAGDVLEAMPPAGRFHAMPDSSRTRTCLAFAAGSGITPVLSIVRTILEQEAHSRVLLFYGNRRRSSTMFIEDLHALKNRFPERLQLHFVFSQEQQEFPIMSGRLEGETVRRLYAAFCRNLHPDEAYICGPGTMLDEVRDTLVELGMDAAAIHVERYGVPRRGERPVPEAKITRQDIARITVIMDGHRQTFDMSADVDNIVDAAAGQGIELPYSCKGGVCATCRTFLREGEVAMQTNYALEPWEVEKGFVLACQSRPLSDKITIDYDQV